MLLRKFKRFTRERRFGRVLFWSGIALSLVLYILATAPGTDLLLFDFEVGLYRAFESTEGATRGWDWTLLVTGSLWWLGLILFAAAMSVLHLGWIRRRKHFGRDYGYAVIALVVTCTSAVLFEEWSEEIPRSAPWTLTEGAEHDLAETHSPDFINFHARTDLLNGVVFSSVLLWLLLMPRFFAPSLIILFGVVTHSFGRLALGSDWLTSLLISWSAGFVAAGAMLAWCSGLFRWAERKSERIFVRLFWRFLFSRSKRNLRHVLSSPRHRKMWEYKVQQDFHRQAKAWKSVVERRLLPLMAPGVAEYKLLETPPDATAADSRSPYVRFLHLKDGPIYVVKMARRTGLNIGRPGRIERYNRSVRNTIAVDSLGVPVPRVYWATETVERFGFVRTFIGVEEFIDGLAFDPSNADQAKAAAQALAKLHSIQSGTWRTPDEIVEQPLPYSLIRVRPEVMMTLRKIGKKIGFDMEPHEEMLWQILEKLLDDVDRLQVKWRLIHGDFTKWNLIFREGKPPCFIDLVDMRYDISGPEALKASRIVGREDVPNRQLFWETYFANGPDWEEFLKQASWSLSFLLLREMAHSRVEVSKSVPREDREKVVLERIRFALSLPRETWGDSPRDTDWQRIDKLFSPMAGDPERASWPMVQVPSSEELPLLN